jgi:hypothetical protein
MHKAIYNNPVKNNSGYAQHIGDTSYLLESLDQGLPATATGSVVVDGTDTDPAISAGEFAHNHVKPIAKRITTEIAGLPSSVLLSGASVPELTESIHKIESIITTRQCTSYRNGDFNYFTGKYVVDPVTVVDTFHKSVSSAVYIDSAANASRTNTGKLVYFVGSNRPTSKSYATKTA